MSAGDVHSMGLKMIVSVLPGWSVKINELGDFRFKIKIQYNIMFCEVKGK